MNKMRWVTRLALFAAVLLGVKTGLRAAPPPAGTAPAASTTSTPLTSSPTTTTTGTPTTTTAPSAPPTTTTTTTTTSGTGPSAPPTSSAGPTTGDVAPQLQDEAEIARQRDQANQAVTAANAKVDQAKTQLAAVKKIVEEIKTRNSQLNDVHLQNQDPAKATADSKVREADLTNAVLALKKQLLDLDPEYDATGDGTASVTRSQQQLKDANDAAKKAAMAKEQLETKIRDAQSGSVSFSQRMQFARAARCRTAYCFGSDGTQYAFEPMLELPIGTSFAIGEGALARFENATEFSIQFSAGLRFWFAHDLLSISLYFAKPIYSGDVKVRVPGSAFEHPTTSIRRLGPSVALGLFGDVLFLGGGYDELRNGSSAGSTDSNYAPNQVLSRVVTVTIGLAPFAAIRNVAGMAAK